MSVVTNSYIYIYIFSVLVDSINKIIFMIYNNIITRLYYIFKLNLKNRNSYVRHDIIFSVLYDKIMEEEVQWDPLFFFYHLDIQYLHRHINNVNDNIQLPTYYLHALYIMG